jgi:hypothetical protein
VKVCEIAADSAATRAEEPVLIEGFGAKRAAFGALVVDVVHWIVCGLVWWSGRGAIGTEKAHDCGPWMKWNGRGDAERSG